MLIKNADFRIQFFEISERISWKMKRNRAPIKVKYQHKKISFSEKKIKKEKVFDVGNMKRRKKKKNFLECFLSLFNQRDATK